MEDPSGATSNTDRLWSLREFGGATSQQQQPSVTLANDAPHSTSTAPPLSLQTSHQINLLGFESGRVELRQFAWHASTVTIQEFFDATDLIAADSGSAGDHFYDAAWRYAGACDAERDALRRLSGLAPRALMLCADELHEQIDWLAEERNTWILLRSFLMQRARMRDDDDGYVPTNEMSDAQLAQSFVERDAEQRFRVMSATWLEQTAWMQRRERLEAEFAELCCPGRESTSSWKELLTGASGVPAAEESAGKSSERVWQLAFMLTRCGQLERAQHLLVAAGIAWKAALLEGRVPLHVPSAADANDEDDGHGRPLVSGNPNRLTWKRQVWKLSETASCKFERAVYGAVCGNAAAILPACDASSWRDAAWCHFLVSADIKQEMFIASRRGEAGRLPAEYWSQELDADKWLCMDDAGLPADIGILHCVDKAILLDNAALLKSAVQKASNQLSQVGANALRFAAHLVLYVGALGCFAAGDGVPADERELLNDTILFRYITQVLLTRHDNDRIVAFYAQLLQRHESRAELARIMRAA